MRDYTQDPYRGAAGTHSEALSLAATVLRLGFAQRVQVYRSDNPAASWPWCVDGLA